MKKINIQLKTEKILADTFTAVSAYLKLRDHFPFSILLESSDYHGNEHSFTYICLMPVAFIRIEGLEVVRQFPGQIPKPFSLSHRRQALTALQDFVQSFQHAPHDFKFITQGIFGYMTYDAVQYFEEITFDKTKIEPTAQIPPIQYYAYKYILAFNHYNNELYIVENQYEGDTTPSQLPFIKNLLNQKDFASYRFELNGEELSNFTDEEFLKILQKGKDHCFRGDVFQIVLSRRFTQKFRGDEFTLYRALRSINPSPYLFYFDFGNFKIFGSSPEAQLVVRNGKASIYPIAGTFRRTGDDKKDAILAEQLFEDEKENSEHIMLVDLARNDLSIHGENVKVATFKDIQYYSHVIHLVSHVIADVKKEDMFALVGGTFPAGTLSGAPKYMAMTLIDRYENVSRSFYGGAIGHIGFDNSFNHAIIIRSFLSQYNTLHYQAGAGVVALSKIENELQEVHNKLAALRRALQVAVTL
ncbi:MAG: anthranilate synthase component I family protein [Cytophagales bacterium]|nr:anthranilate synthase component I family protein [Cytophagales bacterium]MDW8383672.1 anthranilate synthase component I family protein [Flammeovirgaceae bacterium]